MSLVNLTDIDIFVKSLTFEDGTVQTEGRNPNVLDYYDVPPASNLPENVWNVAQTTDPFGIGIYMVHIKLQIYTPNSNAMNIIQIKCEDTTTTFEIKGSIFNFDNTLCPQSNNIRSIDKTYTFIWDNLSVGNTFSLQTNIQSLTGGAGFKYELADGAVIQIIKIN
jgi:hypothetical protein